MRRTTAKAFSVTKLGLLIGFKRLAAGVLFTSSLTMVSLASAQQRPPAAPLIVHDPYFSVWSMGDRLTDGPTRHWTGTEQKFTGVVRIDGVAYRFMGDSPAAIPALRQISLEVSPTHTSYDFETSGMHLKLTFFTPAFPADLDLLSRPVTYLDWKIWSVDTRRHSVSLLLDVDPMIAVNTDNQPVTWGRTRLAGLTVLSVGSRDQQPLNRAGDNLRIDWGYFHLGVPAAEKYALALASNMVEVFAKSGVLPEVDELDMPRAPREGAAHLGVAFTVECESKEPVSRHVLVAYTQDYAIEYMNRRLRPYWMRNRETVQGLLARAESEYVSLESAGVRFDRQLREDLEHAGGTGYAQLATLAYRQTLGAHALVADVDGSPMLFAKENFSNGDIATVDVLYPSAPFFLLFNPTLLEAQLRPVLDYARLPRWKFSFAPHDLGKYPLANGQDYGGGELTEEDQMPVEESANLLILGAALGQAQGNWHLAEHYWPEFTKWAEYLRTRGFDPENQLCTDDFAGHLAHNTNLSIKAIEALGAYSLMARGIDKPQVAQEYFDIARTMAAKWERAANDGDHYKLAFDRPGTWSQKYNLVWDQLLGLRLFPPRIASTELSYYAKHVNLYGLPLDSRANYTKLDWELWTATLSQDPATFKVLLEPVAKWLNEGPTRVPLTDWYNTKGGKQESFQARSVVGGVYVKMLADPQLAQRWRNFSASATGDKLIKQSSAPLDSDVLPLLRLACIPAGDVIQLLHEKSHCMIARSIGGGH
ncbi:MAG TPA: DUF4965 domain-containing protein [Candidatus Saccharimonadales bacterium]|nr:DUF4965 domain-containing protein [Candidatus Saccharimonadales bacterium]